MQYTVQLLKGPSDDLRIQYIWQNHFNEIFPLKKEDNLSLYNSKIASKPAGPKVFI